MELAKRPEGLSKVASPQLQHGIQEWDFRLQPNPAGEHVVVEFQGAKVNNLQVRLVDMFGVELILSKHRSIGNGDVIELDLSTTPNGMYLVELTDGIHRMSRTMCILH